MLAAPIKGRNDYEISKDGEHQCFYFSHSKPQLHIFNMNYEYEEKTAISSLSFRSGYIGIGGLTSLPTPLCKLSSQKTTFHCQLNNNHCTWRTLTGDLELCTTLLACLSPPPTHRRLWFHSRTLKEDEAQTSQKAIRRSKQMGIKHFSCPPLSTKWKLSNTPCGFKNSLAP